MRWVPLAAVAALLGASMLATILANPVIDIAKPPGGRPLQAPSQEAEPTATPVPTTSPRPQKVTPIPQWVSILIAVASVAIVLALIGYFIYLNFGFRLGRRRPARAGPVVLTPAEQARQEVEAAIAAGLVDLDDDGTDPRRAVIACWLRLESAAAGVGVERFRADTSSDLVSRLLAADLVVRADVLEVLADLYRQARYAPHDIDPSMRDRARAALIQLQAQLAHPVGSGA
jgi:hypothetical protein